MSRARGSLVRHPVALVGLGLHVAVVAGCASGGKIVLHQPFAPPSQQKLELASHWTYQTTEQAEFRCLLAFPLPGAKGGPRAFVVYLRGPDRPGLLPVDTDNPDAVQGFLIQELGNLAGRTDFVAGAVRLRGVWLAPARRRLDINVRCADGTELRGEAVVEVNGPEVRAFELKHAGDLALLERPDESTTSAPAEPRAAGPTGNRPLGGGR